MGDSFSAGVIIINAKESPDDWAEVASHEIKNAKKLVKSQVKHIPHTAEPSAGQATPTADEEREGP
jgi:hypothetical protein